MQEVLRPDQGSRCSRREQLSGCGHEQEAKQRSVKVAIKAPGPAIAPERDRRRRDGVRLFLRIVAGAFNIRQLRVSQLSKTHLQIRHVPLDVGRRLPGQSKSHHSREYHRRDGPGPAELHRRRACHRNDPDADRPRASPPCVIGKSQPRPKAAQSASFLGMPDARPGAFNLQPLTLNSFAEKVAKGAAEGRGWVAPKKQGAHLRRTNHCHLEHPNRGRAAGIVEKQSGASLRLVCV